MAARRAKGFFINPQKFSKGFWNFRSVKKNKDFDIRNLYVIVAVIILMAGVFILLRKSEFPTGGVIGGDFVEEVKEVVPVGETYFYPSDAPVVGFSTERFSLEELNFICGELKRREIDSFRTEDLCIVYPSRFDIITICNNLPAEFGALNCENLEVCFSC